MLIGRVSAKWCVSAVADVSVRTSEPLATAVQEGRARKASETRAFRSGLVEAGEELVGVGRDEQRVEVLVAVGSVSEPNDGRTGGRHVGDEIDGHRITSGHEGRGGEAQVRPVEEWRVEASSIGLDRSEAAAPEVQDDVGVTAAGERDGDMPDGAVACRNVECQVVPYVGERAGTFDDRVRETPFPMNDESAGARASRAARRRSMGSRN